MTEGDTRHRQRDLHRHASSAPSGKTVTVDYATADGTRDAARRLHRGVSGTLTFTPGQTSKTVTVPVKGDTLDETDETFVVNLSNAVERDARRRHGVGTITDDDPPSARRSATSPSPRATAARANVVFTVTLTRPAARR